jgi:ribose transport system substrate-binding protein
MTWLRITTKGEELMNENKFKVDPANQEQLHSHLRNKIKRRRFLNLCIKTGFALPTLSLLSKCQKHSPKPVSTGPFNPDGEIDHISYNQLTTKLGNIPKLRKSYKIGVVVKFLGNDYWKLLADGMQSNAGQYGIALDIEGAATESDRSGQLSFMEKMVESHYDAILLSPQTDENLIPAVEKARRAGVLLINVDDAVLKDAEHFVGPNQYENGIRAAKYIIQQNSQGGEVAVIEGQAGVYAAKERTKGFIDTVTGTNIKVVADKSGEWDLQKSLTAASDIITQFPDIKGFYCNNDIMALGVVEAVNKAGRLGKIITIGTDGIRAAYDSIRAGELTATVDSFPFVTGQIAIEVTLRLLGGQELPRVVFSPQNLITKSNIDNPLPA